MKSDGGTNTSSTAGVPTTSEDSGAGHWPASSPGMAAGAATDAGRPEPAVPAKTGAPERRSAAMARRSREERRRTMVVCPFWRAAPEASATHGSAATLPVHPRGCRSARKGSRGGSSGFLDHRTGAQSIPGTRQLVGPWRRQRHDDAKTRRAGFDLDRELAGGLQQRDPRPAIADLAIQGGIVSLDVVVEVPGLSGLG